MHNRLLHITATLFRLFTDPDVDAADDMECKFVDPDEEGLIQFLCTENNFAEDRVKSGVKKMLAAKSKGKQGRLDSFFKVVASTSPAPVKRKADPKGKGKAKGNPSKRGKR